MRIISGQWRGRRLHSPQDAQITRPTADRTRETLFSMLTSRLGSFEGLRVLDLFAGTGALGLEALSRGAAYCLFVEQDRKAKGVIDRNIKALDADAVTYVRQSSVLALGPADKPYDLIFMDPPYHSGAASTALDSLTKSGWFAASALIIIETARGETIDNPGFAIEPPRNVGKAALHIMRPQDDL